MPLKPLSKKVIGDLIEKGETTGGIYTIEKHKKVRMAMEVMSVGDGCVEVSEGDIVILPEGGWVVVSLTEDNGERVQRIAIPEELILAKVF